MQSVPEAVPRSLRGDLRMRDIYNLTNAFIGVLTTDGTLVDANESSLNFAKVSLDDVVGKPFWETPWWQHCCQSRDALKVAVDQGTTGEATRFEAEIGDGRGTSIFVDFILTPVFDPDGVVTSLVAEGHDITALREATEALRENDARLRLAHEIAGIGTWDWDLESDALKWDARQFELFGIPRTDGPIEGATAISTIHPDDRDRVAEAVSAAVEPHASFREEFRVVHADGSIRWLAGLGDVLRDTVRGKSKRMIGVNFDITERKAAEKQLARANANLEARVAERTAQLELEMEAREQAQAALAHAQRIESVGQLAGGVAHDFNNLLAVIGGNLELATLRALDDKQGELIRNALDAVASGASLTQRLLSFARKRMLQPARISVNCRCEETTKLLERTLGEDIALKTRFDPNLWDVFADPGELDSAIVNLAVNARDAMPDGGRLTIETGNETFDEDETKKNPDASAGDYVRISITDNGNGMPPDVAQQAINPFFTTKAPGKGSGLGLSSVFGFARQSGGFVTIDSEMGRGTTVHICLPRARPEQDSEKAESTNGELSFGDGELILVVEDDKQVRDVTLKRLEALGYAVIEAATGSEAVDLISAGEPVALIFSDIVLPGEMSGYDLAAWIEDNRPAIKVLLTSGYNDPDRAGSNSAARKNVTILTKPYPLTKLAHSVRSALVDDAN